MLNFTDHKQFGVILLKNHLAHAYRIARFEFLAGPAIFIALYIVSKSLSIGIMLAGRMPIVRCLRVVI